MQEHSQTQKIAARRQANVRRLVVPIGSPYDNQSTTSEPAKRKPRVIKRSQFTVAVHQAINANHEVNAAKPQHQRLPVNLTKVRKKLKRMARETAEAQRKAEELQQLRIAAETPTPEQLQAQAELSGMLQQAATPEPTP